MMIPNSDTTTVNDQVETSDRSIRFIGAVIVLVTFGLFGGWAFFAPMDSSALATGVIVVKSYKKTVQHLDGGIVAKIFVKDGDLINEGEPLLLLDDAQIKAQLEIARGQFIALAAQVARLQAERDQLLVVTYPESLNDPFDLRIKDAKQAENNVFFSRKNSFDGQISVLNQRIAQVSSKVKGLQALVESKKQLISSYAEEIDDLKVLLAEGFADKQRLRDIDRSHALQSGEIAQLIADIATNQMLISETQMQILQIRQTFLEDVANKLSEAQVLLNDATERMTANQDKLQRIVIKAPATGMVQGLAVHTENGVILSGHPILDIVPQNSELIIEAQVSPMDIDRVVVGLKAEVRFSAFKQSQTPKMMGKVIHISPDRFVDEKTGQPYYQARVELSEDSQKDLGKLQLVPGMPAEVLINTGERTLYQYLAQPASNAIARAFIED